ncbi:restriction endonuclease subunit S [uncultured Methanomethylovorans sp.]|uniref:restriction endonuclease subunit S n=1 Tax=uncultured Methanomethylovorans sp. TaxID=183759 RepID=UPI00261DB851|nr:restriction endonuclease subunit S [uncultured Methanomethylovorans sp.]
MNPEIKMKEKVGWVETNLATVSNKITDGSHNPPPKAEYGEPMLSAQNIFDDHILFEGYRLIKNEDFEKEYKRANVEPRDVLLTIVGTIGRSIVVPDKIRRFTLQRSVALIKPNGIESRYLSFYLRSPTSQLYFENNSKGTAQKGIYLNSLGKLPVLLAPLPEQRAIVSRIEQLFSDLDNGIANLRLAQEQLKVYRQAVLKKAFEGELTRKWRDQQTDLPNARDLLEQIRKEREEAAKVSAKKVKPVKPLTEDEIAELPSLPEGWGWVKIGDLSDVVRGGSPRPAGDPKYYGGEIPFLKVADLTRNDDVYLKDHEYTIKEAGLRKTRLVEGNNLLLSNSGATLGVPKICTFKTTFNDGIAAFLDLAQESMLYHYYFWLSKTNKLRAINQGAAQPNLNTDIISNYPFPLCSIPEQHAIVEEIETRLSVCDKMAQDIDEALEKAEALRQSILKKAFEGKLLSERELAEVRRAQDWEPADVLLERIRMHRAGNGKK